MADQGLQSAVSRLEAVASRLESLAAGGGGGGANASADEVAPFVVEYDAILNGPLAEFLKLSNDIGGDVKELSAMVKTSFYAVREFLVIASKSMQPPQDVFAELLKPVASGIQAAQAFRENKRRSDFFNHLSAVSESIAACGWISVTPTPSPYIRDMVESGMFYSNRVLKDFKEKDARHVEWTKAWNNTFKDLQQYVKSNHTTGVSWNPRGVRINNAAAVSAAPSAGGAPPPPPPGPPPPPPPPSSEPASSGDDDNAKSALFASINQGDSVTKGLRKVSDDMKTHKNPALRQGPAPFKATAPKPTPAAKPVVAKAAFASVKPPVFEKQGKKWLVENHKDNKNISIDGDIRETVYVFKCEGSVIQVKGKINSVVLDSCKKTAVVLEDVLSSVEFVNCQSVQGQVTGKFNTLSIDKTDGCQFYLSKNSLEAEIVSAKSSEMNVLVPTDDGDFKEFALPEQYKTKYDGKTMVTTVAESI